MITDLSLLPGLPDGLLLYATAIEPRQCRREAETAAVDSLVKHAFGPEAILNHREDGSPVIENSDAEISVSHSRTHAFLTISPQKTRIGIDAEQPRQQLVRVAHKFLSPTETELWTTQKQLLTAWTIKEAVYKAAGVKGLPLTDISLPTTTTSIATIPDGRQFRIYTIHTQTHTVTVAMPV